MSDLSDLPEYLPPFPGDNPVKHRAYVEIAQRFRAELDRHLAHDASAEVVDLARRCLSLRKGVVRDVWLLIDLGATAPAPSANDVLFRIGLAALTLAASEVAATIGQFLREQARLDIRIDGSLDPRGAHLLALAHEARTDDALEFLTEAIKGYRALGRTTPDELTELGHRLAARAARARKFKRVATRSIRVPHTFTWSHAHLEVFAGDKPRVVVWAGRERLGTLIPESLGLLHVRLQVPHQAWTWLETLALDREALSRRPRDNRAADRRAREIKKLTHALACAFDLSTGPFFYDQANHIWKASCDITAGSERGARNSRPPRDDADPVGEVIFEELDEPE